MTGTDTTTAGSAAFSVSSAKLRPPPVRSGLIDRNALVERLRTGRERTLTLVCAPAGYGKTTLLAQWAEADRRGTPFVWISLEERDSDPVRLWGHLIGALHEVHAPVGATSLQMLVGGPPALDDLVIPALARELADAPPFVVVVDDWHLVRNPICDQTLATFVDHAPEAVQVVIASRSDPGLPIGRLRAHGELVEVREHDLRVSSDEAIVLFQRGEIELDPDDITRLTERTEGWLAGLCLARIVLQGHDDPRSFVADFSGDSRLVLDYLVQDVLATIEPELRDFVVRTSILERLSPSLCNAVLERDDSAKMLTEAEHENLFLVRLDETGSEYRYHQLFAAVLEQEFEANDPAAVPELHGRASCWHEEYGDSEQAVRHAIESRDVDRASTLVTRVSVSMLSIGRGATVNLWLEALSWPAAESDPQLGITRALAAGMSRRGRDEIEHWLEIAAAGPETGPLANGISSLRSGVAMIRSLFLTRGIAEAERGARLVLENEPEGSPWRYAGLVPLGQALFFQGRFDEARAPLAEARALPGARRLASMSVGMSYLALIELEAGDVAACERLARDALALAIENGHPSDVTASNPHLALGRALMQGPDLHAAIDHLERAVELTSPLDSSYWHVHALLHLAAARHKLGDAKSAVEVLARARAVMDDLPDPGMLGDLLRATQDDLSSHPRRDGFLGDELSEAELRVLRGLASDASLGDVARYLFLSPNTVKTHRRSIYRKLGVGTRDELLVRAAELGLVTSEIEPR